MNYFKKRWKKKAMKKTNEITAVIQTFIQPFTEIPTLAGMDIACEDRINAHDLFCFYTADIIKKEVIFIR